MNRKPQEIFQHHATALIAGDLDAIVADYTDDAVIMTPAWVRHGKAGVRQSFAELLQLLPEADWQVPTQIFEGDALLIEWSAVSKATRVLDGVDTFVFTDDGIRLQTLRFTVEATTG